MYIISCQTNNLTFSYGKIYDPWLLDDIQAPWMSMVNEIVGSTSKRSVSFSTCILYLTSFLSTLPCGSKNGINPQLGPNPMVSVKWACSAQYHKLLAYLPRVFLRETRLTNKIFVNQGFYLSDGYHNVHVFYYSSTLGSTLLSLSHTNQGAQPSRHVT